MRKSLFTAAALAPLMLLAAHGAASADTTISDDTKTAVKTSTANAGKPDNLIIGSGGSVTVTSGSAVTVDSDNTLSSAGSISLDNASDSNGVLIQAPHTGTVTNSGVIENTEDYTATDTNSDGILDGPYAQGSNRYGIRLIGPGTFTGDIVNSGGVTVDGNQSYGISLEFNVVGGVTNSGSITVMGDNTTALRTSGVSGDVLVSGAVTATGGATKAIDLQGDIGGGLSIYSTVQATGYRTTARPSDPTALSLLTADDLLQSGAAVTVAGNVGSGIFVGAPPGVADGAAADQDNDHDGIADSLEGTGSISVYGAAPALLIGSTGRDAHIGAFGTGDDAFGLIVEGTVSGQGVFDGIAGNAVQVGTGDGAVQIDGGIHVVGTVSSTALNNDATSLHLMKGATTPTLRNDGTISSVSAMTDSTAGGAPNSRAVLIEQGASLSSLNNLGTITAATASDAGSSYAIQDKSGTLTSITNSRAISAVVNASTSGVTPTGKAVAIDVSANTSGVTITQNPFDVASANVTPSILGDILLGSGNDTVSLHAGTVTGALDFGAGSGSLLIDGGASYLGQLTTSGPLAIDVANGVLDDRSSSNVSASSLHVGSTSTIYFAADPASGRASSFNVAGAATFDAGARIGLNVISLPQGSQTFTIVHADHLSVADSASDLLGGSPYLFVTTAHVDQSAGDIDVDIRRRTAQEAGFNRAEAAAYDAIYQDLPRDPGILSAMVNQTSQEGLLGVYQQMLPDYAGVTRALSWASEEAGRAAADWPRGESSPGPTRGWTQEIGLSEDKDRDQAAAWRLYGFGAVGGVESVSPHGNAIGLMTGFTAASIGNPDTPGADLVSLSQFTLGAYWRLTFGRLHADVQGGGGYVWAHTRRELIYQQSSTDVVYRQAEADWNGYSVYGRFGLAYDWQLHNVAITPTVHVDYFRLAQGGYTENGGDGFDLNVNANTTDVVSLTSSVVIGYTFGDRTRFRPEVELGWRQVLSGSGGVTDASFVAGGSQFTLLGEPIEGGGPIGRIGLRVFNDFLDLKLDAGGEWRDDYVDLDVRITARVVF